ncbi:hypothetical protein V6R21_02885 [Limibacter armeniacum]|uniref:hypothetical protein n=1 Tax=Limibacter armeniacum TaxID=466084 RepID=UPI002FE67548
MLVRAYIFRVKKFVTSIMKAIIRLFGVTQVMIGGYYVYKTGFHLINYNQTFGLEPGTFGYGRPFWEVAIEFLFWLTVTSGGIGLLQFNKIGLKIGLYSLVLPTLVSITFLIAELYSKRNYSSTIIVNTQRRDMTLFEQWNYIYSEPVLLITLTLACLVIFWLTMKQLKM